jgi:phosphonate transport system substrate-binding protein
LSVTGYVAPEAELFAPRGLNSDTFFASVHVGNHQNNMLAVVNKEVDIATTNNPDLDLFARNFPHEAAQLKVIWRSSSIPCGVLVIREGLSEPLRSQLIAFMREYGKGSDAAAASERAKLALVPDLAGFDAADSRVLKPFVDMEYALLRQQAKNGRWVSEQARDARLHQIESDYQQTLAGLRP